MLGDGDHATEKLPFSLNFQNPLTSGTTIVVEGNVPENASTFFVNFGAPIKCCFYSLSDKDVAFSLSPQFDRRFVVRNSTKKKKWQREEIAGNTQFPLRRGSNFRIEIFVAGNDLLVAINGVHYCTFRPGVVICSINSLDIDGDICLAKVSVRSNEKLYPDPLTCQQKNLPECISYVNCDSALSQHNLKVPLICLLPRTLQNGDVIRVEGRIKLLPYRFLMNLRSSEARWPPPNILLHINGRYSYSQKNNVKDVFVFNSWSDGRWGVEKKATDVSLPMPGNKFNISITCRTDSFEVNSDESLMVNFPNRLSLEDAKVIYVQGDVHIYSVSLQDTSSA